ncbi:MAG TPA: hypothetical protein VNG33_02510, partial [Polyangiaceae bacterium]|nr:hypothetical protein [Polyangiaceae bacterium]
MAGDRPLALCTALLAAVTLLPLFVTPFLPLADLPAHTAQGALLPSILFESRSLAAYHYQIQWVPVPYWTTHIVIALLSPIVGALAAAKIMVGGVVIGLPLAVMRVLIALRRDPRLGLWAFLMSWDHNVYAGWIAYMLGMVLALWAVAWLLESQGPRQAVRVGVFACVVGVTHVQAVAYLGLICVFLLMVRRPFKQALLTHAVACSGFGVSVVPWLVQRWHKTPAGAKVPFTFDFSPLAERVEGLFRFTLDNQPKPNETLLTGTAFLLLLFGVPLLASLPQGGGDSQDESRASEVPHAATAPILLITPLLLYLLLPMSIGGPIAHWYTYPRYATFAVVSLLFLPRARFLGAQALWLLPGVLGALACQASVVAQFADFARRTRPFLEIIAHVRPNSAYLPLELNDSDPATKLPPLNQIHSYIAAVKHGY